MAMRDAKQFRCRLRQRSACATADFAGPKSVAIRNDIFVEAKGVTGISNPCVWRLEMQ